jgi:hypothetical protein
MHDSLATRKATIQYMVDLMTYMTQHNQMFNNITPLALQVPTYPNKDALLAAFPQVLAAYKGCVDAQLVEMVAGFTAIVTSRSGLTRSYFEAALELSITILESNLSSSVNIQPQINYN